MTMNFIELHDKILQELGSDPERARAANAVLRKQLGEEGYARLLKPIPDDVLADLYPRLRASLTAIAQNPEAANLQTPAERAELESAIASHILKERAAGTLPRKTTDARTHYWNMGTIMWPITYGKGVGEDPKIIIKTLIEYYQELAETQPDLAESRLLMLRMGEGQMSAYQAATWIEFGAPVVQLASHRYAAALASTSIPGDIEVKCPWPCFLIELPVGMFGTDYEGSPCALTHVMVNVIDAQWCPGGQDLWSFVAYSPEGVTLYRWRQTLESMRDKTPGARMHENVLGAFDDLLDSRDDRTLALLSRIVLSTCVAMSNPEDVRPIGKHPSTASGNRRFSKEPTCRTYRVGKPIQLDVRPALQAFLDGKRHGASPTIQFVVRGHWRNQACGPALSLRKTIWVQPYWKGPEDAAINVRDHVIADKPPPP